MKRKTFIKTTSALAMGSLLSPLSCTSEDKAGQEASGITRSNWSGNYTYQADNLVEPGSTAEIPAYIKSMGQQKALGTRHCFNNIADSPRNQISSRLLNKVIEIDEAAQTITVESGAKYGELAPILEERGFALHNLASLPHISVAGAISTATHGSGINNGNLATGVRALKIVNAQGETITLQRGDEQFNGAVVGLGALGFITEVTLDIQPTFMVRQDLFQDLPVESLVENFDAIMSAGYSVSLFTDWMNQKVSQIWIKRRMDQQVADLGPTFFGAQAATRNLHPITALSAENCTEQLGFPGPWHERLPHFKMGFMPSSGAELQSEYFVPYENGPEAYLALQKKASLIEPHLLISEIRTVAADDLWMSTCYKRKSTVFHFTWKQDWENVSRLLPIIEKELAPFKVRPHWGKLFAINPGTLRGRYPRYNDFVQLARSFDPQRKFKNDYLDLNIY